MRIGIDIRPLMTAPRTGVGEYTFELLNAIFNIDTTNQYFLFYNSWTEVAQNIPSWNFPHVKIIAQRYPNKIYNGAMRLFGRPRLDKVCPCEVWFSPNLNFTALTKKVKNILTVHDLSYKFFPEFSTPKQFWWHKIVAPEAQCRRADVIITPSANTRRDLIDYYHLAPEKIKVIYPGVRQFSVHSSQFADTDLQKKYNLPEKFILFLGTIEPRKNIIGLIEAFEKTEGKIPLVIAGASGWKNAEIFSRAKNSKLADQIKFIGFVAPEDKPTLYSTAEIFIYPSLYEGFGFPVLEAMSAGTPVITSNRSSLPEIADSAAYLIDPTRPDQLALAINELLTRPALRDWHAQKGREQAAKFTWEKAATEWLNLVKIL
ncbi:MAG: glycosyltransferase family 1 protein [Patescibacteria group bacterium]|nr:glycosyltransferase family 1 protein [Patescibacteria group bacterium]